MTSLKDHPLGWTRADAILELSSNQEAKYFALQILETAIKKGWKTLPREQCEAIKKYIVGLIMKTSSVDPRSDRAQREKVYLDKLNTILVLILERDYPEHWLSFISDIVGASKTNESLCQNFMVILRLLSEELFPTQKKAKHLKDSMCSELPRVFQHFQWVMVNIF